MTRAMCQIRFPQWSPPESETVTLLLKIVTPMFGGGATPRELNKEYPVNGKGIRGQLRFWWRAANAHRFRDPEDLFRQESEIWGRAGDYVVRNGQTVPIGPGVVDLRVRCGPLSADDDRLKPCCTYNHAEGKGPARYKSYPRFLNGWPGYALFPFQGKAQKGNRSDLEGEGIALGLVDYPFEVSLRCPDEYRNEVLHAVALWIRYGGVGSRTRRGCGTLELLNIQGGPLPKCDAGAQQPEDLTHLFNAASFVGPRANNAVAAWNTAVEAYQGFRQGKGFARRPPSETHRPGRSYWPEPDSIRRRAGITTGLHAPEHPVKDGFPRADLGLPIIFHFQGETGLGPPDPTLQQSDTANKRTRFASPVITKAIQEGNQWWPLVMVLSSPHVWHIGDLTLANLGGPAVGRPQVELTPSERQKCPPYTHPLSGMSRTDLPIRQALGKYIEALGGWRRATGGLP